MYPTFFNQFAAVGPSLGSCQASRCSFSTALLSSSGLVHRGGLRGKLRAAAASRQLFGGLLAPSLALLLSPLSLKPFSFQAFTALFHLPRSLPARLRALKSSLPAVGTWQLVSAGSPPIHPWSLPRPVNGEQVGLAIGRLPPKPILLQMPCDYPKWQSPAQAQLGVMMTHQPESDSGFSPYHP